MFYFQIDWFRSIVDKIIIELHDDSIIRTLSFSLQIANAKNYCITSRCMSNREVNLYSQFYSFTIGLVKDKDSLIDMCAEKLTYVKSIRMSRENRNNFSDRADECWRFFPALPSMVDWVCGIFPMVVNW